MKGHEDFSLIVCQYNFMIDRLEGADTPHSDGLADPPQSMASRWWVERLVVGDNYLSLMNFTKETLAGLKFVGSVSARVRPETAS